MKSKYLAAVSGGPDSMAMLDIYKHKIIAVCHVNYNKRKDSMLDFKIVKQYCNNHNIAFYYLNVSDDLYTKYKINNFQKLARIIRYDFFLEIAQKVNCFNILLAHNKNDFLETAYMQVLSKKKNLYFGIRKKSTYQALQLYRPLITKTKKYLENYCIKNNIKYQIDYTNNLMIYQRNKVRKIIMQWNCYKRNCFFIYIMFKNFFNYYYEKKIKKTYSKWKFCNYDLDFIKKKDQKKRTNLIYYFLEELNLKRINANIIKNFDNFILNNKKKVNKKFRLSNQNYVIIINNQIKILGK